MSLNATFLKSLNKYAMESSPDHVFMKLGTAALWVAGELEGDGKHHLLADPDLLFSDPGCEVIKDQKKIKIGRIELMIGGRIRRIYLKRYNAFSWRYRLVSLFLRSAASRSWFGAAMLMRAGFRTGSPIAAVECRSWGMLTRSFYLSEEIPGGRTADAYWHQALTPLKGPEGYRRRRGFLRSLANLFHGIHRARLYHNDLKDANILVCLGRKGGEEFFLLDLEGIRNCRRLSKRRQIKNLVQLNRTMGRFLQRSEKLYWLKVYMGDLFFDRGEKRRWIGKVLEESARRDRRSLRKG